MAFIRAYNINNFRDLTQADENSDFGDNPFKYQDFSYSPNYNDYPHLLNIEPNILIFLGESKTEQAQP